MKQKQFIIPKMTCDCPYIVETKCRQSSLDYHEYFTTIDKAVQYAYDNGFEPYDVYKDGSGYWKKSVKVSVNSIDISLRINVRPVNKHKFCGDCYWTQIHERYEGIANEVKD